MLDDIYEVVAEVVDSNLRIFLFGGDLSLTSPMLHSQRFANKLGYEVVLFRNFMFNEKILMVIKVIIFDNFFCSKRPQYYHFLLKKAK